MIIANGRISFPQFDAQKWTDNLRARVETEMRNAAREWLRAVVPRVPVWTGTSAGTLMPLSRFLRAAIPAPVPEVTRKGRGVGVGEASSHFEFSRRGHRFYFKWGHGIFLGSSVWTYRSHAALPATTAFHGVGFLSLKGGFGAL